MFTAKKSSQKTLRRHAGISNKLMSLEPRWMFDAAGAVDVAENLAPEETEEAESPQEEKVDIQANAGFNLLATPAINDLSDTSYTEQGSAYILDSNVTITNGGSYDAGYVEFDITNGSSSEHLTLADDGVASTADGVVSIVGNNVFLGNGTTSYQIGTVDSTYNGLNGNALRVNFSAPALSSDSELLGGDFNSGSSSWDTASSYQPNSYYRLSDSFWGGYGSPGPSDPTNPSPLDSSGFPSTNPRDALGATFNIERDITVGSPAGGLGSMKLSVSGVVHSAANEMYRSSALYTDHSTDFTMQAGDTLSFDWMGVGIGGDHYDLFAYVMRDDGTTAIVENITEADSGGWQTAEYTFTQGGTYRLVILTGSYDANGDAVSGSDVWIDNIKTDRLSPPIAITDAHVTQVAQAVQFSSTSNTPETSYTYQITARDADSSTSTASATINVTAVDDTPVLATTSPTITITEGSSATAVDSSLTLTDADAGTADDAITGATVTFADYEASDSVSFTSAHGITGSYDAGTGILTLSGTATAAQYQEVLRSVTFSNSAEGSSLANTSRTVTFAVPEFGLTAQRTLTINLVNSAPVFSDLNNTSYFNVGLGPVVLDSNVTLNDSELLVSAGDYTGASLTIARQGGANIGDLFSFNAAGASFTVSGNNLQVGGQTFATFSLVAGTFTINFTGTSAAPTQALVNDVLQRIQYDNTATVNDGTQAVLEWTFDDGNSGGQGTGGAGTVTEVMTVAFNNAPTDIVVGEPTQAPAYTIEPGNSLVNGLGGSAGFGELASSVANSDDSFQHVDISAVFENGLNFFGENYSGSADFYIGSNGYVTFGHSNSSFSPLGIPGYTRGPLIAGLFTDIDPRDSKAQAPGNPSAGGNSLGTHDIYYHVDETNGIVTITWDDVGPFSNSNLRAEDGTDVAFQIRLHKLGDNGDFAIEIRYENVGWVYSTPATAGWTAGDGTNYGEVTGSGTDAIGNAASTSNIDQAGVWVWEVRGGSVTNAGGLSVNENAAAGTVVVPLSVVDNDAGDSFTYSLLDDDGGRFELFDDGGTIKVRVANGAVLDFEDNPTRSITVQVTDAGGLTHSEVIEINLLDVNEAPTDIALSSLDIAENSTAGDEVGNFTATDPESTSGFTYQIVGSNDFFNVVGNRLVVKAGANLDFETAPTQLVTVRVTDSKGLSFDKQFTINVTQVNEVPVFEGDAPVVSYTEDGNAVQVASGVSVSDPDGFAFENGFLLISYLENGTTADQLTIQDGNGITRTGNNVYYNNVLIGTLPDQSTGANGQSMKIDLGTNATQEAVQALLGQIHFSNNSDNPSTSARSLKVIINDGGVASGDDAQTASFISTVNVVAVNDFATIDLGNVAFVTERTTSNPTADYYLRGLEISDPDGSTATLELSVRDVGGGDLYGILNIATNIAGGLTAGDITGNGTGTITITASLAQINATFASATGVQYVPDADKDVVVSGHDQIMMRVTDDQGAVSELSKSLAVLPATPTARSANIIGSEDSGPIRVDLSALVQDLNQTTPTWVLGTGIVSDSDGSGGSITGFDAGMEIRDGGVLVGYTLTSGVLRVMNGTTFADGQFEFTPNENWNGIETILFQYSSSGESSEVAQVLIYVAADNDAPTVTVPTAQTVNEDTALVFSSSNGNAISLEDVDLGGNAAIVTLSASNGNITLASLTGLEIIEGQNGSGKIVVKGSLTNLQAALDGVSYQGNANYHGSDTLSISMNDQGFDGEGGAETTTQTIAITIDSVNDAPTATRQLDDVTWQGDGGEFSFDQDLFTDVDSLDVVQYSAQLSNGTPLPNWLNFNEATRTVSGIPPVGQGAVTVRIFARDGNGGVGFQDVVITYDNQPPVSATPAPAPAPVDIPSPDQDTSTGTGLNTIISDFSAQQAVVAALTGPSTAPVGDTAQSSGGFQVASSLATASVVRDGNLFVNKGIAPQFVETNIISFNVPQDAFGHTEQAAQVELSAKLVDGQSLPAWLNFDSTSGAFFGNVPQGSTGVLAIVLIARDAQGNEVSTIFNINMSSDAPSAIQSIPASETPNEGVNGREQNEGQDVNPNETDTTSPSAQQAEQRVGPQKIGLKDALAKASLFTIVGKNVA